MTGDVLDRRVLAAVRFTDPATGAMVREGLRVESDALFRPNRSGAWVLWPEGTVDSHARTFASAPGSPAAGSVTVDATVHDTRRRFEPRAFSLDVPRVGVDLHTPVDVMLPSGPGRSVRLTWARIWVSVSFDTDGSHPEPVPIQGALVRLESVDLGGLRGIGFTNDLGQAMVVAAGIPRTAPGVDDESVLREATDHDVHVVVDLTATDAGTGRHDGVPDPDDLWTRRGSLTAFSRTAELNAGDTVSLSITVPRS